MFLRGKWLAVLAVLAALVVRPVSGQDTKTRVAVFHLNGAITETPLDNGFPFAMEKSVALKDLVARLDKARHDEAVKGIVLLLEGASLPIATAEELRQAIAGLREAGKEIYAHADELSMHDYNLLSGATRLSVVPTGDLWLTGLYAESPYVRGLLTKLGVTPDFMTCGDYKSAAEIFMREGPSPAAEEMQNWLLDGLYETYVKLIAQGRGVEPDKVRQWIDGGPYTAAKAQELGMIDVVEHRHEFEAVVKQRFGADVTFDHKYGARQTPEIDLSSPFGVLNFWSELLGGPKKKTYKDSVAIVYVDGPIMLGDAEVSPLSGSGGVAASTPLRKALDRAADDETIKAVVLRVNSPGGSAVASEIILDATKRVKAKKPLVVSMGEVAGSGGYYVACGSDVIFADESTITGSIGVVGGKLATTELWNKLGIHWKAYSRGANASLLSSAQPFTPEQRERMQAWMDEIYGVFKSHVVAIRGDRLKKDIDELAGGRVYTGRQALDLGLVDRIGSLNDAVKFAAEQAQLADYDLRVVPEPKNFLELLLESSAGGDQDEKNLALGTPWLPARQASPLFSSVLPYLEKLDPQRLRAVATALLRLEMLDREGAVLMMPELVIGQ